MIVLPISLLNNIGKEKGIVKTIFTILFKYYSDDDNTGRVEIIRK